MTYENTMRRLFSIATILTVFFFLPTRCFAEEPQLTASVDKQAARVNEEIHLNVKIIGVRGSLQAPRLPSLEGFEIFYSGRASRFSFVNGQSESMTEFNYVLIPRSAGRFVLQPIEIKIGDQTYHTNQLEIRIDEDQLLQTQATTQPQARRLPPMPIFQTQTVPTTAPFASNTSSSASISDSEIDKNIFLKASLSQLTVYTNQQLILTYSLFTRYDTRYEGFIEEPELNGFWTEEFPMDQNIGRDTELVNGKRYVRADVKKIALFPTAPGQYQIKPGVVKTSVQIDQPDSTLFDEFFKDSFFGGGNLFAKRVEKHLAPPPVQIVVKPLPEAGKPDSFKGAVGDFRMATSVDKRIVNQNEAVTLQIALEGEGNIETLVPPTVPEIPAAKRYESDTQTQLFRARNVIAGKKTFEIVIIPGEAGELVIPSVEFSFFNPKIDRYVALKSDSYKIKVNPSRTPPPTIPKELSQGALGETKKAIRLESEDIQYIKERISASRQPDLSRITLWLAVMNGVITFVCIGLAVLRKRDEYFEQNVPLKRNLYAKKYAGRGLRRLDRLAKSSSFDSKSDELFFEESTKILNQYLSDKLNLSPQGLTQSMIEQRLGERGAEPETIRRIRECYDMCDQIRFGKMGPQGTDRELVIKQIREIIYALERR